MIHDDDAQSGWKTAWGFLPPIVGWLVAALIAWGLMGTRVAVLEQRSIENERRVQQAETDLRSLTNQLQEIQRSVYEVNASVQRLDAKITRK